MTLLPHQCRLKWHHLRQFTTFCTAPSGAKKNFFAHAVVFPKPCNKNLRSKFGGFLLTLFKNHINGGNLNPKLGVSRQPWRIITKLKKNIFFNKFFLIFLLMIYQILSPPQAPKVRKKRSIWTLKYRLLYFVYLPGDFMPLLGVRELQENAIKLLGQNFMSVCIVSLKPISKWFSTLLASKKTKISIIIVIFCGWNKYLHKAIKYTSLSFHYSIILKSDFELWARNPPLWSGHRRKNELCTARSTFPHIKQEIMQSASSEVAVWRVICNDWTVAAESEDKSQSNISFNFREDSKTDT